MIDDEHDKGSGSTTIAPRAVVAVIAACCSGCCPPAAPPRAATAAQPPVTKAPIVVPLAPYKGRLRTVAVTVAGEQRRFLFDTGAGVAMITPAVARQIGCSPHGRMTGFRLAGDRIDVRRCERVALSIGGRELHHETVGVLDLMKLLPAGWPQLAGVIGLRTFERQPITLQLRQSRLLLESPASLRRRIAGARAITVRPSRQLGGESLDLMVALRSPRGMLWALLDSGCLVRDFILAPHAASALGIDLEAAGVEHHPADKGHPESWSLARASVRPAGLAAPVRGRALVKEIIYDGVVCASLMQRWSITLDLARSRGWISARQGS